jgi:hypothetical protein
VSSLVLPRLPGRGGSVSMREDQIHDGRMDNTVLSELVREHGVAP